MTMMHVEFLPGDDLRVSMRDMLRLSKELNVGVTANFNDMRLLCFPHFNWDGMLAYNDEAAKLLKATDTQIQEMILQHKMKHG